MNSEYINVIKLCIVLIVDINNCFNFTIYVDITKTFVFPMNVVFITNGNKSIYLLKT